MKKIVIGMLWLMFISCSNHRIISSLSISTTLETEETIVLDIEAIDNDGISSVIIDVQALNYFDEFKGVMGTHWSLTRTFSIPPNLTKNSKIKVKLIDALGNEKVKIKSLTL